MACLQNIGRLGVVAMLTAALMISTGCGKKKPAGTSAEMQKKLEEVVKTMNAAKEPYKGNLTPEKAAEITHEVSAQSMAQFPTGKNLPRDPKALQSLNDRIRETSNKIYASHGTTMEEMMHYISTMAPKDREKYNKRLTELFLEQSRKRAGKAEPPQAPAQPQPPMPAKPGKK